MFKVSVDQTRISSPSQPRRTAESRRERENRMCIRIARPSTTFVDRRFLASYSSFPTSRRVFDGVHRVCSPERRINRYYDPMTGQFVSVDRELPSTRQPYSYSKDNPIESNDPLGLSAGPDCTHGWPWNEYSLCIKIDGSGTWVDHITTWFSPGRIFTPMHGVLEIDYRVSGDYAPIRDVDNDYATSPLFYFKYGETYFGGARLDRVMQPGTYCGVVWERGHRGRTHLFDAACDDVER